MLVLPVTVTQFCFTNNFRPQFFYISDSVSVIDYRPVVGFFDICPSFQDKYVFYVRWVHRCALTRCGLVIVTQCMDALVEFLSKHYYEALHSYKKYYKNQENIIINLKENFTKNRFFYKKLIIKTEAQSIHRSQFKKYRYFYPKTIFHLGNINYFWLILR